MAKVPHGALVSIEGGAELYKLLRAADRKVARKILRRAMREGARIIQAEAKERVPVRSGKLRDSIKVRAAKRRRKGEMGVIVTTSDSDNLFSGEAFYGGMVEFGTTKAPPKPFMRPAADVKGPEAINHVRKELERNLANEVKRP